MADREQWPTDPEFRLFAARVADRVQVNGHEIGLTNYSYCPLGHHMYDARPGPEQAAVIMHAEGLTFVDTVMTGEFIRGFEELGTIDELSPYFRLGAAYRRWALGRDYRRWALGREG